MEWGWIEQYQSSIHKEGSDDVDALLRSGGFSCAYDDNNALHNWPEEAPLPHSHWFRTSVDPA